MNKQLEKQLSLCENLPSLPSVAVRIIELSRDASTSMGAIGEVVTQDPALAAKILRTANSPHYARRRRCESFRQALVLLGLNATLTIALTFSLVGSLRRQSSQGLDRKVFWRRSLLAAVCARALGENLGVKASEELFLAALLQDIGMLALDRIAPELYGALQTDPFDHMALVEGERQAHGVDHADVGAWLLERWHLPDHLRQAVAASHGAASQSRASVEELFIRCVKLSGRLADLCLAGQALDQCKRLVVEAGETLGLEASQVVDVVNAVTDEIPEIETLFEMSLVDPDRLESIREEAREALIVRNLHVLTEATELRERAVALEVRNRELEEQNRRDALTGAYNRAYLDTTLEQLFQESNEHGFPLSVAFVDLDHFKRVNDTHGHQVGDSVLVVAAKILGYNVRSSDVVARYGGEEFVILLPYANAQSARGICDRIVKNFATFEHEMAEVGALCVTASVGLATHGEGNQFHSAGHLTRCADSALYRAKNTGRNRCVTYERMIDAA